MLDNGVCNGVSSGVCRGECSSVYGVVRRAVRAGTVVVLILLAGCSSLSSFQWPWRHKPTPPPQEVHELEETGEELFPQYWSRNTLLVDLRTASGSGSIVLKRRDGAAWPVRLGFRVMPGTIGALEIRADQRTVLPITTQGSEPMVLELVPGIYTPKTAQMTVSWGPSVAPAP